MSVAAENQLAPVLNIPAGAAVTSEAVAAAVATATTYDINFDFSSIPAKAILADLQGGKYQLMGYKGASGPGQVSVGLPTWFSLPFTDVMGGKLDVLYTPTYLVYYFDSIDIDENTVIQMSGQSQPVTLGTELILDSLGNFTVGTGGSAGTIQLKNNRPSGTPNLTVGLAASVNGKYAPFCAFTITPLGSIEMTPHENVCLFASQLSLASGTVTASAATPGVMFSFLPGTQTYDLAIAPSTYAVVSAGAATKPLDSGDALNMLNKPDNAS